MGTGERATSPVKSDFFLLKRHILVYFDAFLQFCNVMHKPSAIYAIYYSLACSLIPDLIDYAKFHHSVRLW